MNFPPPGSLPSPTPPPGGNRQGESLHSEREATPPRRQSPTPLRHRPDDREEVELYTSLRSAVFFEDELPRAVKLVMDGTALPEAPRNFQKKQVEAWLQDVANTTGGVDEMLNMLPISSKQWLSRNLADMPELAGLDRFINVDRRDPEPHYILFVIQNKSDRCLNLCHPLPEPIAKDFTAFLKQQYPIASDREDIIKNIKPEVRQWLEASDVSVSLGSQGKVLRAIDAYVDRDTTALTLYPSDPDYEPSFLKSALKAIKRLLPSHNDVSLNNDETKELAKRMSKTYRGGTLCAKYKEIIQDGVNSGLNKKEEMAVALALVIRMSNEYKKLIEPTTERFRSLSLGSSGDEHSVSLSSSRQNTINVTPSHRRAQSDTAATGAATRAQRPPRPPVLSGSEEYRRQNSMS